jgi:spore germination cell wall hydrolase CwlJ-like protein
MKMSILMGGFATGIALGLATSLYLSGSVSPAVAAPPEDIASQYQPIQIVYVPKYIEVEKPILTLYDTTSENEFYCLAQNIYFESRGESAIGQEAVAWVTMNRVFSIEFPNTICNVVWQSGQFSWTNDGKSDKPKDKEAWEKAKDIATYVLKNYHTELDPTEGSTYFHADYSKPSWRKKFNRVVQIDNHVFYNEEIVVASND